MIPVLQLVLIRLSGYPTAGRGAELYKIAGVPETLDLTWVLMASNIRELAPGIIDDTLGIMVKYQDDIEVASVEPVCARQKYLRDRGPRGARRRN